MKLARAAVFACVAIAGCCFSYESDVNKICNLRDTCPAPFEEEAISHADRRQPLNDCLGGKLYTSEGRALLGSIAQEREWTQAALLSDAATQVGLKSCPWADELISRVDVPAATGDCTPLPTNESGIDIIIGSAVSIGDMPVLYLPEKLEKGVDARHLNKNDPLEVQPLCEAVRHALEPLKIARRPYRVLFFVSKSVHPMPEMLRKQLLHTVRKARVQDTQQVFLRTDNLRTKLCTTPMR